LFVEQNIGRKQYLIAIKGKGTKNDGGKNDKACF